MESGVSLVKEPDTDSGRPASLEEEDEEDEGLIIRVPARTEEDTMEPEQRPENGAVPGPEAKLRMPRIPTLVCEEHRDDEEPSSPAADQNGSSRRVARALSKQCVIDDDSVQASVTKPLCILVDTRTEAGGAGGPPQRGTGANPLSGSGATPKEEQPCLPSASSLTSKQWADMADRRRQLAAQLLGRTPLALSQSEGNLGNTKSFPPLGANAKAANAKQLVRSHALCGDDDTRLRPPAEFARSNPSFAATKSLSRDSSATDYTDSSGVDLYAFIMATLHKNEKDRNTLLDLERQLVDFIEDKGRQAHKFAPMSSYNRMIVHRVAAYFGLDHNIDQSGQCIVVNMAANTRIPEHSFTALIQNDNFTDAMRKSLSREAKSYEEIRDYSCPHQRGLPLDQLSRRTRSFEVSSAATTSAALGATEGSVATGQAQPVYALSPVMQQPYDQVVEEEAALNGDPVKRRGAGLAHLHKAGSFGGVPVYYRANSNGVRPVEEMRVRRGGYARSGDRHRGAATRQAKILDTGEYYSPTSGTSHNSSSVPPDPYYRNAAPVSATVPPATQHQPEYCSSGPSSDTTIAPSVEVAQQQQQPAAGPGYYGGAGGYGSMPVYGNAPMQYQPFYYNGQMMQMMPNMGYQMDEMTQEMVHTSISSPRTQPVTYAPPMVPYQPIQQHMPYQPYQGVPCYDPSLPPAGTVYYQPVPYPMATVSYSVAAGAYGAQAPTYYAPVYQPHPQAAYAGPQQYPPMYMDYGNQPQVYGNSMNYGGKEPEGSQYQG